MKSIYIFFASLLLTGLFMGSGAHASSLTPKELQAYVDQRFGMFIHFNMGTFARQPFLSVGGEHEIGRMPTFEEVDLNQDGNIDYEDQRKYTDENNTLKVFSKENESEMYDNPQMLSEKRFKAADTINDGPCAADDNKLCKKEYDQVREDLDRFKPTKFSAEQWAEVAKEAGVKYAILVTKHHGGFSLWDTYKSRYDVKGTNWNGVNGEKDIVKLFVDAFRARNIAVGFYYSIFDKTNGDKYGVPEVDMVKKELSDLLETYGEVGVLWFDGWGWKNVDGTSFYESVPYAEIEQHIRGLSPNTIIIENHNDTWNLEEQKYIGGPPDKTDIIPFERNYRGLPPQDNKLFVEVSDSIRAIEPRGRDQGVSLWFYHPKGSDQLKNLDDIVDDLHTVNARKAAYLLNVTPDTSGQIPVNQVELLKNIGKVKDLEIENDKVSFYVKQYNAPTLGGNCPDNANQGKYGFKAVLKNISGEADSAQGRVLSLLHVEVDKLTNSNALLLENGAYVREGGQFMVPGGEGLLGGGLTPGSEVAVPFTVCLANTDRFQLFVNVKSVAAFDDTVPALIQSDLGDDSNSPSFEMVVREENQLCHWWRDNAGDNNKWDETDCFGENVNSAPAFTQNNLWKHGSFEVIYRTTDNKLRHYWRDNSELGNPKWKLGNWSFGEDVASAPGLVQSSPDGNLEVVYRDSANRLRHWWRGGPPDYEWHEGGIFGVNAISAPALIQSDDLNVDKLHVVVRESNRLRHYFREKGEWNKDIELFGANVTSAPTFIQSKFGRSGGGMGNFEVVVKEGGSKLLGKGGGLRHYFRKNNEDKPHWRVGDLLPNRGHATSPPTLIQSKLGSGENFELVVREDDKLMHYFRRNNVDKYPWGTTGEIKE